MEDDDEFGDLYTDVLQPLATPFQSLNQARVPVSNSAPPQSLGIDLNANSDDDDVVYGPPDSKNMKSNPNSAFNLNMNAAIQDNAVLELGHRQEIRGFDLNVESNQEATRIDGLAGNGGSNGLEFKARVLAKGEGVNLPEKSSGGFNFMEENNDINIFVEETDNKDDVLVEKDNRLIDVKVDLNYSADGEGHAINLTGKNMVSDRLEDQGASNHEDEWESEESEDDLQIVLNDNSNGPIGMERVPGMHDEDDEDGDQLVIVADNGDAGLHHHHQQMMMEEQDWAGEEGLPGADGEKKELSDASKASGAGGTAIPAALQPRIGYSNHMYHHQFHSQFKYVRPGAAPFPGASPVTPGGIPGPVRPPVTMSPVTGRGRGDWRPAGTKGAIPMQKGFPSSYGTPVWGTTVAGRGYGSGLDFTLPSHKTIFEVDIDNFEEKPWKFPGIDVSDFFNFGLNEESWKEYCKQLEQLRLETTMQSKIRVYESGRSEQDYDPDLPPELAAAVGIQDIPPENANPGNADSGPTDLVRESARERPPLPIGRPIPVETGSGDRLPSIDTRRLRLHDSDAIIEIACHSSTDDDDVAEKQDNDQAEVDPREGGEVDDLQQEAIEHIHGSLQAYDVRKREHVASIKQFNNRDSSDEIIEEDVMQFPSKVPAHNRSERDTVGSHEGRSADEKEHVRSLEMNASDFDERDKKVSDDHAEESFDNGDGKQSPSFSFHAIGSDAKQGLEIRKDMNDDSVIDDKRIDDEADEMAGDATVSDTLVERNLVHSTREDKLITVSEQLSQEQLSQENDGRDSKAMKSSESSKARSGSSKDHQKFRDGIEDEVVQEKRPRVENIKRSVSEYNDNRRKVSHEKDETGRHHTVVRGKEDSYSRRGGDPDSSLRWPVRSESSNWRKESDISEVSWHRRDEELPGKRTRTEEASRRDHGGETASRNRGKTRESERSEKDEHRQSRLHLDNGSWRGAYQDQDIGSRLRDRDDNLKGRVDKMEDFHSKRRKEETHISRGLEDISYNQRESSNRRKRERDDSSDQRKRDDQARLRDGDLHYMRQKEESSLQRERSERQRERDEWHRLRQSHEEILPKREREETRSITRSGHAADDKTRVSHSRGQDDYRGSSQLKDLGRHADQFKRRDRVETENYLQHRGHEIVNVRGNHFNTDEKRTRSERPGTRDERGAFASDTSTAHEYKQKDGGRRNKESETGDSRSLLPSKRTQSDRSGQISKTRIYGSAPKAVVNLKSKTEQETGKNEIHLNRQPHRKSKEEASSDDEQPDSRKGRSKFERWTSHKQRDINVSSMSSSVNNKDPDTYDSDKASLADKLPEEPSKKDDGLHPSLDDRGSEAETNESKKTKAMEMEDKHLDTVEKLKKRSERFKLPMPSEKDAMTIKKLESEPLQHSSQTEIPQDSEIKSERPARKRRWTGN